MKVIKKIFKAILVMVIVLLLGFAGIIIYAVISDFKPGEMTALQINDNPSPVADSISITLLTWNIGYCGLDKDMDFFYDGGTKVFTPEEKCYANLKAARGFLNENDTIDFVLLQEVDRDSRRSYNLDQYDAVSTTLDYHSNSFAVNYKVFFVPVPPSSPMGKVYSGIATFGRYKPLSSVRYSFPGQYSFPKQLFMLDRCFMVNRYPLSNGKELVLINTHNEAFDPGEIRKAQMEYLREIVLEEYLTGNYVVAGGDWNQCPPDFKPEFTKNKVNTEQMEMPSDYLPAEWKWIYDKYTPSERSVIAAYDPAVTTTTVIDLFLISPNVEALSVKCIDLGFENSDHNPVKMEIRLK
jgi:endonuclease/exonuclease/phosphatase family metal-dependent hydrolase